ncbi:Cyclin-dependent kinase 10 [Mortierella alpina]|uniref:Cyclin-dependent kinase 10 n=1 Tax=Mortierella alpina TaxID=64518 RepID=A0A9P6LZK7_MORAP|nr:Cyclin-dependent kinase 10 [Mortierella alpina]
MTLSSTITTTIATTPPAALRATSMIPDTNAAALGSEAVVEAAKESTKETSHPAITGAAAKEGISIRKEQPSTHSDANGHASGNGSSHTVHPSSTTSDSNRATNTTSSRSSEGHEKRSQAQRDSLEAKTQHSSDRGDKRPDNRRSNDHHSPAMDDNKSSRNNQSSSSASNRQTLSSSHRDDRHRSDQPNSQDHKERSDADSRKHQRDKSGADRPSGTSRGGDRDTLRDKDNRSRNIDQRARDDRQPSQAARHQSSSHALKNKDRKQKDDQKNAETKGAPSQAGTATTALTKPDPLNLLSITGRMGSLTPQKAFFGTSRVVDDFEKLNKVGEGTYGVVYRARDKRTGEIVALKRIRMERENDGLPISSLREIKLLKTLRHDNIVLVKEVAVGSDLDQIFLVMEYCEQDMAALMDNVKTPYTAAEVKCLMYQLLKGIEYCHDHYVIHRDLKLSNLLLNAQGILKIADFGLARSFGLPSRPMTPKVVTLWYRAPELLFGDSNYTTAVDMWSAGCIFGELLKHGPLLPGKVEKEQVGMIIDLLGTPHEKIWQGFSKLPLAGVRLPEQRFNNLKNKFPKITDAARSLLSGLLTYDPKKRLSVKQALVHPYFFEAPPAKHPSLLPTHPEIRNVASTRQEENPKLKRQPPGDDTESIGNNRKRMR